MLVRVAPSTFLCSSYGIEGLTLRAADNSEVT
jgi:hypothetical protein